MNEKNVGGILIVDDDNKLKGIVTTRDLRFVEDADLPVRKVMTGRSKLVVAPWKKTSIDNAREIMQDTKVEKLPLVDSDDKLKGLVTAKEIADWIGSDGYLARPIAVSKLDHLGPKWAGKLMIHDGHHRTAALKRLNCTKIMVSIFNYQDPRIKVFDYNDTSIPIPKEEVVRRATSGMEVTPRFDKHFIDVNGKLEPFHDNDVLEPVRKTPLAELR